MQCFSLRDLFKIEKQCGNSAAVKANRLRDLSWEWQCILRDSRFWSAPRCSSQCEKPFIISLSLSRPFSISLYIKFCFPLTLCAHNCFLHWYFTAWWPDRKIFILWYIIFKLLSWDTKIGRTDGLRIPEFHFIFFTAEHCLDVFVSAYISVVCWQHCMLSSSWRKTYMEDNQHCHISHH